MGIKLRVDDKLWKAHAKADEGRTGKDWRILCEVYALRGTLDLVVVLTLLKGWLPDKYYGLRCPRLSGVSCSCFASP